MDNRNTSRRDTLFEEIETFCKNTMKGDKKVVYDVNELDAERGLNKLESTIKPKIEAVKATNWRANNFKPKTYGKYVEICHLCGNKSSHDCHPNICIKCGIEIQMQHYLCASCKRTADDQDKRKK